MFPSQDTRFRSCVERELDLKPARSTGIMGQQMPKMENLLAVINKNNPGMQLYAGRDFIATAKQAGSPMAEGIWPQKDE
jgi:hypothetical protein